MKGWCAWCLKEGREGFLGEREPFEDPSPTHGICERHSRELLAQVGGSAQILDTLLVVRPGDFALYELLALLVKELPYIGVIFDRRTGERRRTSRPLTLERRKSDRRERPAAPNALGYAIVKLRKPPGAPVGLRAIPSDLT